MGKTSPNRSVTALHTRLLFKSVWHVIIMMMMMIPRRYGRTGDALCLRGIKDLFYTVGGGGGGGGDVSSCELIPPTTVGLIFFIKRRRRD